MAAPLAARLGDVMAEAADYFLGAMDRYHQARQDRARLRMDQESHALQMESGRMQLDAMKEQKQYQDRWVEQLESGGGVPGLSLDDGTAQQAQQVADAVTPHIPALNEQRGNSGLGRRLVFSPQADGSVGLGLADAEGQTAAPLTVDPTNNNSAPLRIPAGQSKAVLTYVQQQIAATNGDPQAMEALTRNHFGLQMDENGFVTAPGQTALAATDLAQPPQNAQPAPPRSNWSGAVPGPTQPPLQSAAPGPDQLPQQLPDQSQQSNWAGVPSNAAPVAAQPDPNKVARADVHDPKRFELVLNSPAKIKLDHHDQKVVDKLDAGKIRMAEVSQRQRVKLAVLGFRAGVYSGSEAMNVAQTGYANMNTAQFQELKQKYKLDSTQLRAAEIQLKVASRYAMQEAGLKIQQLQAQIGLTGAQAEYYRNKQANESKTTAAELRKQRTAFRQELAGTEQLVYDTALNGYKSNKDFEDNKAKYEAMAGEFQRQAMGALYLMGNTLQDDYSRTQTIDIAAGYYNALRGKDKGMDSGNAALAAMTYAMIGVSRSELAAFSDDIEKKMNVSGLTYQDVGALMHQADVDGVPVQNRRVLLQNFVDRAAGTGGTTTPAPAPAGSTAPIVPPVDLSRPTAPARNPRLSPADQAKLDRLLGHTN